VDPNPHAGYWLCTAHACMLPACGGLFHPPHLPFVAFMSSLLQLIVSRCGRRHSLGQIELTVQILIILQYILDCTHRRNVHTACETQIESCNTCPTRR
jgi:hypothetical protein